MSEPELLRNRTVEGTPEEIRSSLFAHLVIQQASMAMMMLGNTPHPETGKTVRDLEAAKLFIDQLEMLDSKTKGNLNSEEASLLKQSLMSLRMAFVEAVNTPSAGARDLAEDQARAAQPPATPGLSQPDARPDTEERRKKFSKKY